MMCFTKMNVLKYLSVELMGIYISTDRSNKSDLTYGSLSLWDIELVEIERIVGEYFN